LGLERKVKCYNEYFINEYVLHTEKYGRVKRPIIVEFVLRDQLLMSWKLIIMES
jgi:hypothetical protein